MSDPQQTVRDSIVETFGVSTFAADHIIALYGNNISNEAPAHEHLDFLNNIRSWFDRDFSHIIEPPIKNVGFLTITAPGLHPCIQGDLVHRFLAVTTPTPNLERVCAICYEQEQDIINKNEEFVSLTCTLENSSCFFCRACITKCLTEMSGVCPVCKQVPKWHDQEPMISIDDSSCIKLYFKNSVVHRYSIELPGSPTFNIIHLPLPNN